jgi:GNAT superfamily N-acetyltransferase
MYKMAIIRKATEADIPRLLELYRQLSLDPSAEMPEPAPEDCRKVLREISGAPGRALLVAEEDGQVVGTLMLVITPSLAHGASPWAVVEHMVVEEKRRSRGIGRQLLEHAVRKAGEAGCYKIMLCSNKQRTDAHRFYRSLGFIATHEGFHRYF